MADSSVDQVATIRASLELMVAENAEIHEYFRDLLEKVAELDDAEPEARRSRFKDLVSMGAFRFNGLDIRHFTQAQHKPLPPPIFLNRTKRRLRNTLMLVDEFDRRGVFEGAEQLRTEIDLLASHIVNEQDGRGVLAFRNKVEALRESSLFRTYLETKSAFIRKDANLRTEAEYLAARESVEEGEEIFRQRAEDLDGLSRQIASGDMALEDAQARLDEMSLQPEAAPAPAAGEPDEGDAAAPKDDSERGAESAGDP